MALTNETAMMAETTVEDDKKPKKKAKIRQKKSTAAASPAAPAATGAIGTAAEKKAETKKIPTISNYYNESIPKTEEGLKRVGFYALNLNRDKTAEIAPNFSSEVDSYGVPKGPSKGGGLSERYHQGISDIFEKLEKAGAQTEGQAMAILRNFLKPENRKYSLRQDSIFNTPEWNRLGSSGSGNQDITFEEDLIRKASSAYAQLKKERDERYSVAPGATSGATKDIKSTPTISVVSQ